MQHLDPKAKTLFFLIAITMVALPFYLTLVAWASIVILFVPVLPIGLRLTLSLLITGGYFAVSAFLAALWAGWAYNNYKYQLTEDTVKIEKGVIWKHYVSIPYERIQNVDIHRGILARILGLSDLQIQTAGISGFYLSEGRLPGLDTQTAEQLRDGLIKKVKGTKQGL